MIHHNNFPPTINQPGIKNKVELNKNQLKINKNEVVLNRTYTPFFIIP